MEKKIKEVVEKAKKDQDVIAVVVFGSFAKGEKNRDIDICLILREGMKNIEMSHKRLEYLKEFPSLDISIFQQLPIYIRHRVMKEGKILFMRSFENVFDIYIKTIKEFESFKPKLKELLNGVLDG